MYIHLYRKQPQGTVIAGRLVINGRWFCNTMERVGYQIPAICYPIRVTHSPKFKRLLPIVQNVPQRSGIRIHRGSKPEHSSGCVLVLGDNWRSVESCSMGQNGVEWSSIEKNNTTQHYTTLPNTTPPQGRTSANVERELTRLILKAQQEHEEIILEVTDFTPGTEYGYNTPCPPELQKP